MADGSAGTLAFLGGTEIVNDERVLQYIKNGYGPTGLVAYGDCGCPQARQLAGCDGANSSLPYTNPVDDPAPWYSSTIPESGEFAGFITSSFTGLSSPYTRAVIPTITGGGVLGRLRSNPRTLTWHGFLLGRTCCGVAYGLRWLTAQLAGDASGCDSCTSEDLDLLMCCPAVSGQAPTDCDPVTHPVNDPAGDAAFRTLLDVGLISGPTVISERTTGCHCGGSCIMEIEFSLVAGKPWFYKKPTTVIADCVPFDFTADCLNPVCVPATCPTEADCATDPTCPTPSLPAIDSFTDECGFCTPLFPSKQCFSVPTTSFDTFFEAVPIVSIYGGVAGLRNVEIAFFENPLSLPASQIGADDCAHCDSLLIRYVPPNSTLVIDGTKKLVTLECPGGAVDAGERLTISPFSWPVLKCQDVVICSTVDALNPSAGSCLSIEIASREA